MSAKSLEREDFVYDSEISVEEAQHALRWLKLVGKSVFVSEPIW